MTFAIEYEDGGFVVTHKTIKPNGYIGWVPLRKFKDQGDAFVYRECDCPKLTDTQIRSLAKIYDPHKRYKRINGKKFVDWDKWAEQLYQEELSLTN